MGAKTAPDYVLHRQKVTGNDAAPPTSVKSGINCSSFRVANIQVINGTLANPAIEVMFWSGAAGKFVSQHTPVVFGAKGAGADWEATVDVNGRIVFVMVTAGAHADGTDIYVSGFEVDRN